MPRFHRPIRALSGVALSALLLAPLPAAAQRTAEEAERQAFFDAVHAPNWLGTDIAHTPVKQQRGGTCWSFSTVSMLESEVLRTNEELRARLEEAGGELNISEYHVVYWTWVGKAREYARRRGEGFHVGEDEALRIGDGGLSHDVMRVVRERGLVPEEAYVVPEDSRAMTREIRDALVSRRESGDWDEEGLVREVREILDRHLAPPPEEVEVDGRTMSPREYARDHLRIDPDAYWEITSYTDLPFYTRGELDLPDNWWDYDGYRNVPLDAYLRILNRALDRGYSVALDTDWGDVGAAWNAAGIAVMHPDMAGASVIGQSARQADFEDGRTRDDHLVHAVDRRTVDGRDWYLIKNSHGTATGRRGYVWMRGDWVAMRVLAYMVHRDAVDEAVRERFGEE